MFLTVFFIGTTVGFLAMAMRYRKKWHECSAMYVIQSNKLRDANAQIVRYESHCALGRHKMTYSDEVICDKGIVAIHGGCVPDSVHHFIVKVFEYDPNDPEDRDFAIRQAEELIETIKKF